MSDQQVFTSLNEVLNVINEHQHKNFKIFQLVQVYKFILDRQRTITGKHFPLIVLEGLDGTGKSTVSKILAQRINGVSLHSPPSSMQTLKTSFMKDPSLLSAYYHLGNYLVGTVALEDLESRPIILDRYWYTTAAYGIAKMTCNGNDDKTVYRWPSDLLKPDKVFLLQVDENERIKRISKRNVLTEQEIKLQADDKFRERILSTYESFADPSVEIVSANGSVEEVADLIYQKILPLLK